MFSMYNLTISCFSQNFFSHCMQYAFAISLGSCLQESQKTVTSDLPWASVIVKGAKEATLYSDHDFLQKQYFFKLPSSYGK